MWLSLCTFTFTAVVGKRCNMSHVSTCSFTPGYEEIRLGSYPITDKNNSHIHPSLFSPLTVTWLWENTKSIRLPVYHLFVCVCLVFLSHLCDSFLTSKSQGIKQCKTHTFLFASWISLYLFEDFMTNWDEKKMTKHRGGNTLNISCNGIKWLSVCPFDRPAGHWESTTATASHTTRWHRFSSPSHYLGRYARGEDGSSVFLQLPFLLCLFSSLSLSHISFLLYVVQALRREYYYFFYLLDCWSRWFYLYTVALQTSDLYCIFSIIFSALVSLPFCSIPGAALTLEFHLQFTAHSPLVFYFFLSYTNTSVFYGNRCI